MNTSGVPMARKCRLAELMFIIVGNFTVFAVGGCGNNSNFASAGGGSTASKTTAVTAITPTQQPTDANEVASPTKFDSLTWHWQCTSDTVSAGAPASTNVNPVVVGAGEHDLNPASLPEQLPLIFNGDLCSAHSEQRDIIFVVDISGSMTYNDPAISGANGNTCGRYDAVSGIVNSYASNGANIQFAVITFSDTLGFQSSKFESSASDLFGPMGSTPSSVLCNAVGATYYDIAFSGAQKLFQSAGRAGATKEIYFISDGEPNTTHEGIAEATSLKTTGITIGTTTDLATLAAVMLKGENQVLQQLASVDSSGNPLAVEVSDASQLAATLATLASVTVVKAEVLYRTVGTTTWNTLDALSNVSAANPNQFSFPAVTIQTKDALPGIEAQYIYWNSNNQTFQTKGTLEWKVTN